MMEKSKYKGASLTKSSSGSLFTTYHLSIDTRGESDWLEIYDSGNDVWFTFKNSRTDSGKETYYHLEVDKDSEFFKNLMEVIKKVEERR